jgi:hypothetical protein
MFLVTATSARSGRMSSLRGELIATLAFKAILLVAIYVLCFGAGHRPPADATATAAAVTGVAPATR